MAKKKEIELNLSSAGDLFSTQEQREDEQLEKVVLLAKKIQTEKILFISMSA